MTFLRPLLATTAAFVLVATTAGTAHAAVTTVPDRPNSTVFYDDEDDEPTFLTAEESAASGINLTSARVEHRPTVVFSRLQFSRLTNLPTDTFGFIESRGKGSKQALFVSRGTQVQVYDLSSDSFKQLCNGSSKRIVGERGTISVSVSRKCLGYPTEVRVSLGVDLETEDGYFENNVSTNNRVNPSPTKWLRSS